MAESERLNEDGLALSAHYQETMDQVVLPYLKERQRDTVVTGAKGAKLFCSFFTADYPRGTVMVVHGFTENAFKFSEIIYSLVRNGFNVCAYDQRGHGRSDRDPQVQADLSLTHVDDFDNYVNDLKTVADTLLPGSPKPWAVFAHSMGGAVTSLFLERYPGYFDRAALCAPMIAANRSGIPFFTGKLICRTAKLAGKGSKRIFMSKPYAGPEDFDTSCATGRERFDWYDAVKAAQPEFHNNGPTYDWTLQSLRVSQMLLKPGAVEKIDIPVRVYGAEKDNSVLPQAQEMFVKRLKDGQRKVIPGSRHEIYRSTDEVLFPWWHEVLAFLKG
ncbi:MAG: alpha/beta hydrolase [Clostridia bacterium]|nr:alpha/beta hydrolase [Clostridia bacterium]